MDTTEHDKRIWTNAHRLMIGERLSPWRATPNLGGSMRPEIIVLHETAGRLDAGSAIAWLCNPAARASAHLVVARYTHRIALSNRRLIRTDAHGVTFTCKDYRVEGPGRLKTMTLATHEFIRRFLMHVPPKGFHRIRHYGLLANGNRKAMVAKARALLAMTPREAPAQATPAAGTDAPRPLPCCCPRCGGRMIITMVFVHGWAPDPRAPPAERMFIVRDKRSLIIRLDTS